MKLLRITVLFFIAFYLVSCGTQKKAAINYVDNTDSTQLNDTVKVVEIKIQKNDLLSIQVYSSSLDPSVDAPYNLGGGSSINTTGGASSGNSGGSALSSGFLVDENGNIEYPRLGTIHAEGLTKSQLADIIKAKLTAPVELLKNPSVIIRFQNFKVTVLGEVAKPGPITIPTGHITVLEAIGLAGDIPITGKKNTVRVLREIDGKREIGNIDLTSKKIFDSPYYNLLQNDVVMVEVTKTKLRQSDQLTLQRITTVLGIITSLTLIYNILK
ncbi:MAG: polysaccharide biosynthesis/export family protein [Bacteroidetes bacterium]|nr:polysaccharide biosynthesis/export family protein [Bacteroidota bacterium]MBS1609045.1 polysaccharide biosynthesis/export family protein [Bacteroidota bacterium]